MLRIYLDNCCFNRPFDDRTVIKNYLERESVLIVMQMAYEGTFEIVGSDILEREMSQVQDNIKQRNVADLYHFLTNRVVESDEAIEKRATEIVQLSAIKMFDGLHLACAETCADVLLTTDVKFLNAANKIDIKVKVQNPIEFLVEVNKNDAAHNDEQ